MLPEQGLLSDCGNNYFQMNSCILAGSIQTIPQVSSGDSEAKPLIFTFVPTVRRLPTHIQLTDTSKFLVKIPEEPSDKSPETVNRSNSNDYLTFNRGSQEERNQGTLTYPSETSGKSIQGRVLETNQPQGMQQSDLFKAEYVFIVDSEGEDEVTSRKGEQGPPGGTGNMAARPKSLAISSSLVSDVVRPKIRGTDLKSSSYSEISHGMASQQKHGQKTPPVPANLDGASVLEEFHTRRLDVSGALVEETAAYFQTTAHSSPFSASKGASWTLPFPHSTQLPGSNLSSPSAADQNPGLAPEVLKKTTPLTSNVLSPRESLKTTSPSPSSSASLKSNSASYIPVRIVMHSLSPSPKPLTSSFHGSSSTVCSQMSSSGNLSKSGVKSQVPSRLSLLTAILKSNPSHQRPVSPASCPTFSLNSLASSTLALDQKVKQTTLTPKKSLSSCSLRAQSPAQAEHQVSELAQQSFHLPFFTKSTPTSQVSSLSPTTPVKCSLVSMNVDKTPSPTSLKSGTMLSPIQTNASSFADLPPVPPSSSLSSSKNKQDGDLRGSENPRNTYTHPSTLASSALSSVSPPINHSTMPSSPEKCFHPSPALSNLIDRSQRASYKPSGQGLNPSALSSPALCSAGCASLPSLGSSSVPPAALPTPALQLSPSTLQPNCGSGSLPSRMMKSESTKSNHTAPVSTPSIPISLTRTKELISPCALSLSTGPENKKPKTSTTLPKAAGRETKYANLSSPSSTVSESQLTKPGVIRPVPVKSKILLKKEEEVYEPNPFSKYLEDNSDLFSEQDMTVPHKPVSLHPLYQTKLYPPAKSLLQPQTLPHADCLTPGPFSHLSSFSLSDEQENSHTLLSHNAYNKLSHPMVAIPEHETLDSKEQ
ncbi:muscular LMNA-interacting protein isoform X15 [Marmota monax]|uniref:muscular LMNA-interacting protein isoform X15 n=1 Tax=Marmota monax TaxID=9995 RepID=UPI0026EB48EA|nr:muscular LMNA-interacting protein isoform X15 [Marmota monax]